jgi:hypothetical protein
MVTKCNKSRIIYFLGIVVAFFCLSTTCKKNKNCPKESHSFFVINNNSNISVNWRYNDIPNDTVWKNNGSTFPNNLDGLISPNSTYKVAVGLEKCWEYYYQGEHSEYYFIFHHDTVQAIGWQAISGTNRGLLKKVKVDLNYLNNNNFTITYP